MSEILDRLKEAITDRYTVERELGRGGMATVFLATDVRHDRKVAIKVLHPDLSATIGADRFEREIKLAAKLQHPHILGLYDSGSAGGLLYYVMPFVEGESVRDKLDREKQLPVDEAIQITLEVADALGYAHAQSIVHRDIKPENVMMSNGHALVADFGIARARTEAGQERLTQTGMAVGTPVYMSPEQSTGEHVGPTADIYSLGCMLYEMLAGEPPFTGANSMAIMAKHAMEAPPSVRVVRPSVPEEVEEAILAAMEKSAADRPKTAAEFCEILGTPLGATATRRVTARYTTPRRTASNPALVAMPPAAAWWRKPWMAAVAALVVVAGGLGTWKAMSGGAPPLPEDPALVRRVAVRYFSVGAGDAVELQPVADRLTESLIRELSSLSQLSVVSANGVAPFRDPGVSRDSIAGALKVGTLIEGTIDAEGADRVRITARLFDGFGNSINNTNVLIARDSLFAAEDAVARLVSTELRDRIGSEIEVREVRSGTRVIAAWTLLNRAERARRDARAIGVAAPDSALGMLDLADSLARAALAADGKWVEPAVARVEVAFDRRPFVVAREKSPAAQVAAVLPVLDSAAARVADALAIDPASGKALEWRGTVKYERWRLTQRNLSPVERNALLAEAEKDLLDAVGRDPRLVTALATLSFLAYDRKDVPRSLLHARTAYERDEFLANSQAILSRLFYGSYDTELFEDAARWCDEGARRFPRNVNFTLCRLWLLIAPDVTPDVDSAWALAARVETIAPEAARAFMTHMARMIVGGVVGRAGKAFPAGAQQEAMLDSARRVLSRAEGDRTVDPRRELPGYRAVMLTQFGDHEEAIRMLTAYVAANPDHSFRVGGNVHWWWRQLRSQPGFESLLNRTR